MAKRQFLDNVGVEHIIETIKNTFAKLNHTHTASDVNADPKGTATSVVSTHNSSTSAHSDIRSSITSLSDNKLNKTDVVANLTTNSASKALSASQGVAIKEMIDELDGELSTHDHSDTYYTKTEVDNKEFITVDDIDAICATTMTYARNMTF